jgi:hypothetical protein
MDVGNGALCKEVWSLSQGSLTYACGPEAMMTTMLATPRLLIEMTGYGTSSPTTAFMQKYFFN